MVIYSFCFHLPSTCFGQCFGFNSKAIYSTYCGIISVIVLRENCPFPTRNENKCLITNSALLSLYERIGRRGEQLTAGKPVFMRIWFSHLSAVRLFAVTFGLLVPARFDLVSLLTLVGSRLFLSYYITQPNIPGIRVTAVLKHVFLA